MKKLQNLWNQFVETLEELGKSASYAMQR